MESNIKVGDRIHRVRISSIRPFECSIDKEKVYTVTAVEEAEGQFGTVFFYYTDEGLVLSVMTCVKADS